MSDMITKVGKGIMKTLIINFTDCLGQTGFDDLVKWLCNEKGPLWGNPIRLGPRKVHIYGASRRGWKRVNVEINHKQMVVMGESDSLKDIENIVRNGLDCFYAIDER